jgi:hypothetical protein
VELEEAMMTIAAEWSSRSERLLRALEHHVWSVPRSPYRGLFAHAGIGPHDVAELVRNEGPEGALEVLAAEGVYVAYEEFLGSVPARRGSATFHFQPQDFFNPRVPPDFIAGTSGTRSSGIPVSSSFGHIRRLAMAEWLHQALWGIVGAPAAIWAPALPSATGITAVLRLAAIGNPPQRWFSQVSPTVRGISPKKRVLNLILPFAARWAGARLPMPEFVTASNPEPVLDWCRKVLATEGRALLHAYASSGAMLAQHARESGVSLKGLLIRTVGEPLTSAKAAVMRASGAGAAAIYGFNQHGPAAYSCPVRETEDLHLLEHEVAVIERPKKSPDGTEVRALLWTNLALEGRSVLINVENDDYGELNVDEDPCGCLLGSMGWRRRVSKVRGLSKVVAGGVTILGEELERLAEEVLPQRFGGGPTDYQFVEEELAGGTRVTIRINPRIGAVDESAVHTAVREALRSSEPGVLADQVWGAADSLRIVRSDPLHTSAGKVLPFETLKPA